MYLTIYRTGAEPNSVAYHPKISEELFSDFNPFRDLSSSAASFPGHFPFTIGSGGKKTLASAGHVTTKHSKILGVIN